MAKLKSTSKLLAFAFVVGAAPGLALATDVTGTVKPMLTTRSGKTSPSHGFS
jgi:hypothetical protein